MVICEREVDKRQAHVQESSDLGPSAGHGILKLQDQRFSQEHGHLHLKMRQGTCSILAKPPVLLGDH